MSGKWESPVISKALQQVLALFGLEDSDLLSVVSYSEDFERLWSLEDDLAGQTVFLLWDETSSTARIGQVDTARHLNPLAWAVCALTAHRVSHVIIVDLAPRRHRDETRLYRFIEAIRSDRLPELRLVPLAELGSYLAECSSGRAEDGSSYQNPSGRAEILDALANQIRIELTEGGKDNDRHALQNILGPLLLLGRTYLENRSAGERALLRLFEGAALLAADDGAAIHLGKPLPVALPDGAPLRLLLVDDQARQGWEDWVRSRLPESGSAYLEVISSPQKFFGLVEEECSKLGEKGDRRFAVELRTLPTAGRQVNTADTTSSAIDKIEPATVLLLDLRLHAADSSDDEATFYLRLLSLCERFRLQPGKQEFAWPGFSEAELKAARTWCARPDRKRETAEHYVALSLLPRLLSLLDPALPIVVFSSTTRREIVDQFRGYQNIITDFRKPVFQAAEPVSIVVAQARRRFRSAISKAVRILRMRRSLMALASQTISPKYRELPAGDNGWLVEIFFDESEKDGEENQPRAVCAGGVIVARALDDQGTPTVSDANLFEDLRDRHGLWGWCADSPERFVRPHRFMPKGSVLGFAPEENGPRLLEEMTQSVERALKETGIIFPFAAIGSRVQTLPDWMDLPSGAKSRTAEHVLDATLRRLVQHVLEGLLFRSAVLRQAFGHPNSRIAIDLGIRDYPCVRNATLSEAFGIEVGGGWRPSFHSEDGFQIAAEAIGRTGIRWPHRARVVRARGVALRDFAANQRRPKGILPKQLHYFSDIVAHVALHDFEAAAATSTIVRQFFQAGWITDLRNDREEPVRFEIGRAWDQHAKIEAFRGAFALRNRPSTNGLGIDVFRELDEGARKLSGQDLAILYESSRQ